jgi:hypothetical protein
MSEDSGVGEKILKGFGLGFTSENNKTEATGLVNRLAQFGSPLLMQYRNALRERGVGDQLETPGQIATAMTLAAVDLTTTGAMIVSPELFPIKFAMNVVSHWVGRGLARATTPR